MAKMENLLEQVPPQTREMVEGVWDSLSPQDRSQFTNWLDAIPTEGNLFKSLVRLSSNQFRQAFGTKHRVAMLGPANVGKSTLYNHFVQNKTDQARVSPIPGTTRINQQADAGLFMVVDTPGADAVGEVGSVEREEAFRAAREADFLVILFDAIQGVKQTELELYQSLMKLNKPFIVVVNKIDLVRKEEKAVIEKAAAALQLKPDQIISVSAKSGDHVDRILMAITASEPEMVAAIGQALPQFRWQLAWRSIVSAASVSALIALTPLPVIDFIPLSITQSVMVLGIARIYNYQITPQRARELLVTFGLGFLGRTLFQELSKLGGVPGWILGAAIAASTTVAMGYAASIWFEKGEKVTNASLQKITREMTAYLAEGLKGMGKRLPGKDSLQRRIVERLEHAPMADNRIVIDEVVNSEPEPGEG